jgi:hypothetical protein
MQMTLNFFLQNLKRPAQELFSQGFGHLTNGPRIMHTVQSKNLHADAPKC